MLIDNQEITALFEGRFDNSQLFLESIEIIDQRVLPHQFVIVSLTSSIAIVQAIKNMLLRGAPLIGVAAAYAVYFALKEAIITNDDEYFDSAIEAVLDSRPTAVNLVWAVNLMKTRIDQANTSSTKLNIALETARNIRNYEIENCRKIGDNGVEIIRDLFAAKQKPINILTHCNAGWLATVDYGTATAPIYKANAEEIPLHVWVDETRPRNQGANLTAWELGKSNISHTLIADNTGGLLMMKGMVDMVIVGADRVAANGDVANKIGTYLKALAAYQHGIPFYVAVPFSTFDFDLNNGMEIPIEERSEDEVKYIHGWGNGSFTKMLICPEDTKALNLGFDITPAKFISGYITERGVYTADELENLKTDLLNAKL